MAISLAPSQYWEGNDGRWSTFPVQVGTPAQLVRVLPSTSQSSIWVVLPQGCGAPGDPSDCGADRGVLFYTNNSASFSKVGNATEFFELPFQPEVDLGYDGHSLVGIDTATLGWDGSGGPQLADQVITGFATKQLFLGIIGLTPRPVNITSFIDQHPSPLGTLRNTGKVKSSYWAYTAGAYYRQPDAYGSLTLGGYDSLRGNVADVVTVPMGADTSRDLVVTISGIKISTPNGSTLVTEMPIYSFIDSTVPEIWLPLSACQIFEATFGIEWNDTVSMYLVNDTQHAALLAQNASVTFTLQATPDTTSPSTDIVLPYASFDLQARYLLANITDNTTALNYFPLMRAANATQLTLGRTFLQEAYVAADYDRSEFHVSPATFPTDSSATHIIAVNSHAHGNLSIAAIVGIALSGAALLLILLFGWRKWKKSRSPKYIPAPDLVTEPELDFLKPRVVEEVPGTPELEAWDARKLRADSEVTEMDGREGLRYEVPGYRERAEVHADSAVLEAFGNPRVELPAQMPRWAELP